MDASCLAKKEQKKTEPYTPDYYYYVKNHI